MISIQSIAPPHTSDPAKLEEQKEIIQILWNSFLENYKAFLTKKMKLEDEINYTLFNAPGPAQYAAFVALFDFLEDAENQIWALNNYMYTHDFAVLDKAAEPAILVLLRNLISCYATEMKRLIMVSGSFWKNHLPTRQEIISLFEQFYEKNHALRVITMAKLDEQYLGDLVSLLGRDSHFGIYDRIPIHFVWAVDRFFYFEFPHTESSVFRLNMLLDLDALKYKKGKSKADLVKYLNNLIKRKSRC